MLVNETVVVTASYFVHENMFFCHDSYQEKSINKPEKTYEKMKEKLLKLKGKSYKINMLYNE